MSSLSFGCALMYEIERQLQFPTGMSKVLWILEEIHFKNNNKKQPYSHAFILLLVTGSLTKVPWYRSVHGKKMDADFGPRVTLTS